jgi:hypothetical protein
MTVSIQKSCQNKRFQSKRLIFNSTNKKGGIATTPKKG